MLKLFELLWVDLKADIFKAPGSRSRRRSKRTKCEGDGSMKIFSEDISMEPTRAAVATGSSQLYVVHSSHTVWCAGHNPMGTTQHKDRRGHLCVGGEDQCYNSDG